MKPTNHDGHGKAKGAPGASFPYDEMHNDDVAHEHSDINIGAILMSGVVVFVVCSVTAGLMYGLFGLLEDQAKARDPKPSPVAMPATQMPTTIQPTPEFGAAPAPRLLTDEPTNLEHVRERERAQLTGYGWVDQKAGVARISIDRAKALMVERGLPVRADAVADPRLGTRTPAFGEASSGRVITKPVTKDPTPVVPGAAATEAPHKPH